MCVDSRCEGERQYQVIESLDSPLTLEADVETYRKRAKNRNDRSILVELHVVRMFA